METKPARFQPLLLLLSLPSYTLNLLVLIDIIVAVSTRGTGRQLCLASHAGPDPGGAPVTAIPPARLCPVSLTITVAAGAGPGAVQEGPVLKQEEAPLGDRAGDGV